MIQEDDVLFEVNTAKVSAEIPSPVAGKVEEILYKEGDTVAVGIVVAIIDLDGEESSGTEPASEGATNEGSLMPVRLPLMFPEHHNQQQTLLRVNQ